MAAIMMADMTHTKLHYTLLEKQKKTENRKNKNNNKMYICFFYKVFRGCNGTTATCGVVADPEYGTLVEYSGGKRSYRRQMMEYTPI